MTEQCNWLRENKEWHLRLLLQGLLGEVTVHCALQGGDPPQPWELTHLELGP